MIPHAVKNASTVGQEGSRRPRAASDSALLEQRTLVDISRYVGAPASWRARRSLNAKP
ncbi:hypothetical protein [Nonomuraea sp. B19D2]|uniref:hypothetical protein n=1 Tax=Nonomuraea sp. B19D2 TaxID=3159561 RepID=UPI0032DBE638